MGDAVSTIGHYHQLNGITNPKNKLLHFLTTKYFFAMTGRHQLLTRDRCCHLSLSLQLILLHWHPLQG